MEDNVFLSNEIKYYNIDFTKVTKKELVNAFEYLIAESKIEFDNKLKIKSPNYSDLFSEGSFDKLLKLNHLVSSMSSLSDSSIYREVEDLFSPIISELATKFSLNVDMYNKLLGFSKSIEYKGISDLRKKMVTKILKDLEDNGVNLPKVEKDKLNRLYKKQVYLVNKFQNNITDAQSGFKVKVSINNIMDLPESIRNKIISYNQNVLSNNNIYSLIVDEQSGTISDIMMYSKNEKLREKIYNKRKKLCLQGKFNNSELIDKIYRNKQMASKLLGYKNHAQLAICENMARTPENAIDFINNIGKSAIEYARGEAKMVEEYGKKVLKREVKWWDHEFLCTSILKDMYKVDQELIKSYFKVDKVIDGLFLILKNSFNLTFKKNNNLSLWHEDVLLYDVFENDNFIGKIYLDLFKRKGKSPGAWLDPISTYENNDLDVSYPVALLVCNISKDSSETLTMEHNDIVTLFHEMGHAIHLLLSKVEEEYFSGFNNVEHDAIEIPSQILENFAYSKEILKLLSEHVETNEKISDDLIDSLINSKKFLSATFLINMVKFSEMDLLLYMQDLQHPFKFEEDTMIKWQISNNIDLERKRMPMFSHIFGGGYSAGYYAYQWADVYAVDAFLHLTETKLFDKESLKRFDSYKKNILYKGGKDSMNDNYLLFRGSLPCLDKYIQYYLN